ncbi:hypothetical protein KLMA_10003 [Kluyveromyces marxianus DMKU3-1042]|uniref:Uncharacterized protein n=1 Tax=Kluyveromyces marxianus (strain DMKU3-1042 / BCC 29191 / NBRC 104275) TaxID=1003335 RepID=W0T2J0_KLUMD|nr:hypothetical protein KLMA_10003 [Kluyveromyces marxianus DMKU3-1042]BAO37625.1 hypothetical protein KLMA_10003 [Kluyveromyces marxianus DMKU3-1042]
MFLLLPGCVSLPNPTLLTVFPFHSFLPLLQLLIFIFFLITSHGANIPTSPLSFSSLYSFPHNQSSVTRTIHNPKLSFPAPSYLPTTHSKLHLKPHCHLPSYPDTPSYHVPPLSSLFHFLHHHFTRHEPTLFSP